jgi:hypothetical protein
LAIRILAFGALLDEAHIWCALLVPRRTSANGIEPPPVDFEVDLQVTRQQHLEPGERPFFNASGSSV